MIGEKSTLLDAIGGIGLDTLARATPDDVLFAASVSPYTRMTVEIAEYAQRNKIPIVAITDSEVAPLARIADDVVLVQTRSASFFHTMTPAFAVAEVLGALVAGRNADAAREALLRFDAHLADLNAHLKSKAGPRRALLSKPASNGIGREG